MSKNFNDFLDTLDASKMKDIIGESKLISVDITNEGMQEYTDTILARSFKMATSLLQNYHDWLNSENKD